MFWKKNLPVNNFLSTPILRSCFCAGSTFPVWGKWRGGGGGGRLMSTHAMTLLVNIYVIKTIINTIVRFFVARHVVIEEWLKISLFSEPKKKKKSYKGL